MKKLIILFIFVIFQSQNGWTQNIEEKILGKWELIDNDISEENEVSQEKLTGITWVFRSNHTCEERSDPSNPNDVVIYEYEISNENCETATMTNFYYIVLNNKTVPGDNYCFLMDIDKPDITQNREILRLYADGAIKPNVLVRK